LWWFKRRRARPTEERLIATLDTHIANAKPTGRNAQFSNIETLKNFKPDKRRNATFTKASVGAAQPLVPSVPTAAATVQPTGWLTDDEIYALGTSGMTESALRNLRPGLPDSDYAQLADQIVQRWNKFGDAASTIRTRLIRRPNPDYDPSKGDTEGEMKTMAFVRDKLSGRAKGASLSQAISAEEFGGQALADVPRSIPLGAKLASEYISDTAIPAQRTATELRFTLRSKARNSPFTPSRLPSQRAGKYYRRRRRR
jgi:hypothetical protein